MVEKMLCISVAGQPLLILQGARVLFQRCPIPKHEDLRVVLSPQKPIPGHMLLPGRVYDKKA